MRSVRTKYFLIAVKQVLSNPSQTQGQVQKTMGKEGGKRWKEKRGKERHMCTRGSLDLILANILHRKCCQALEDAAQGNGHYSCRDLKDVQVWHLD